MRFLVYLVTFLLAGYVSAQDFNYKLVSPQGFYETSEGSEHFKSKYSKDNFQVYYNDRVASGETTTKRIAISSEVGYKFNSYISEVALGKTIHIGLFLANDNSHLLVKTVVMASKYAILVEGKIYNFDNYLKTMEAMGHVAGQRMVQ